jgi:hypothetical protein
VSTNFVPFACFKKLYPSSLLFNCPLTKNGPINYLPLLFTHDAPSFNLVNKALVWYLSALMNNCPDLLDVLNEFHIIIETISIPILVVGRPKKLYFLFCKT